MMNADWNFLRGFHATATTGTLSAAARQLGLTQPTLSRQVKSLEDALGLRLFDRVGRKLVLTETGMDLLHHVERMADAAQSVMLVANGSPKTVSGRVRISASDCYSAYILPEIVAHLKAEAPLVSIEIVASDAQANLHQMEADIAIRHMPPEQVDLVGHHVGETTAGFYASTDWVLRNGMPGGPETLAGADLIGFGDTARLTAMLRSLGFKVEPDDFRLMSDSSFVVWEMVKQGKGVAAMVKEIAAQTQGIVNIFPDMMPVASPIWLVTHKEMSASPRIQVVHDLLVRELAQLIAA
ncbi:LysR family transcriptional regulator (plasmid) [Phaeobacter inhibens]|uniref:LysR family transcriptional regulator n=1 Tax=Phaeobacter inhibens TaxID=221822 RepID=UPI000971B003|nr:LysR family transcriptional regulator [Phaeobacter inhibens]APX18065.1 LysR family transcriptional regulator [Phaeobacter inhibens]